MRWTKISIHTNADALDAVSAAMEAENTGGTLFEPGPRAVGYLPADDRLEPALERLRAALDAMPALGLNPAPADITLSFVEEEDWANAWKAHFRPLRVTDRLTIAPSWEDYRPGPGECVIHLDPGMAFGTGGHPTTRLCLRALETMVRGGECIADVGTGSGVLAIGAALLGARRVDAVDTDPVAVQAARANVTANDVADIVLVRQGDRLMGMRGPYDIVVANILPNVVSILASTAAQALRPGGVYLVSGLTLPYEDDVCEALADAEFLVENRWEEDRWLALSARKAAA